MFKKYFLKLGAFVGILPVLFLPLIASADFAQQNANSGLTKLGEGVSAGGVNASLSLPMIVGRLITGVLGVLGIILVIYIVQAGIMYMTAGGDPAKVDKAKKMITQSVIGMIIIVAAFSISNFVISTLSVATQ